MGFEGAIRLMRVTAVLVSSALAGPARRSSPTRSCLTRSSRHARGALSVDLRCLVCQNQSIDDSNAPLARDLRILVRERLKSGDSDADVMQYVVARYGDFVLLRPPLNWKTLLLVAVGAAAAAARRRHDVAVDRGGAARQRLLKPARSRCRARKRTGSRGCSKTRAPNRRADNALYHSKSRSSRRVGNPVIGSPARN